MLGPKKDKCKVCSLLDSTPKILGPGSWPTAEDSQFCQVLGYQNKSKGLVWHYIDIDAMGHIAHKIRAILKNKSTSFFLVWQNILYIVQQY